MQIIKEKKLENKVYKKHNSFYSFEKKNHISKKIIIDKIIDNKKNQNIYNLLSQDHKMILDEVIKDLTSNEKKDDAFDLEENVISEIQNIKEDEILKYIVHRYRYEIFPKKNIVDDYPPCLQIEPSSVCNYRCVFCFETDKTFTNKKNGFMGSMNFDNFKRIIDQIEGKVEFVTLASRGEPLISKDINKMLKYTKDKFLNLKINTNASLLNEKKCHSILEGGVKTIVFSADAANNDLYKKIRVNGDLNKVLKNIEMFHEIRLKHYPQKKIISRVSGVKFLNEQNFESMIDLWKNLVDQVAFVEYNPWENTYLRKENDIINPCSDLWRRMFIWWDGKANPCDVDYKSNLSVGVFGKTKVTDLWNSSEYKLLRENHLKKNRKSLSPCKSCTVI